MNSSINALLFFYLGVWLHRPLTLCSSLGCNIYHEQRAEPGQSRTWEKLIFVPVLIVHLLLLSGGKWAHFWFVSCWKNSSVTTDSICNISKQSVSFLNIPSWWATWSTCSGKSSVFKALPISEPSQKSQWGRLAAAVGRSLVLRILMLLSQSINCLFQEWGFTVVKVCFVFLQFLQINTCIFMISQ